MQTIFDELLQKKHDMYMRDPVIKNLIDIKLKILTTSFPSYVVRKDSLTVEVVHSEQVQKALDNIDEELRSYIKQYYTNIEQNESIRFRKNEKA